jgi:hypothetical protein
LKLVDDLEAQLRNEANKIFDNKR